MRLHDHSARFVPAGLFFILMMIVSLIAYGDASHQGADLHPAEISVGIDSGDIRGADNRALQAAVDHLATLGGGTVRIGPGRYTMRNALTLRDSVDVVGTPGKTILVGCDGAKSLLACDGDCNERQVTLVDPSAFRVGDGISVLDKNSGSGFTVTTATLTAQVDARTFKISTPLYLDYMISAQASAKLVFPVIGGWHVKNVTIDGLTIGGNRAKSEYLDGCRGGGIYLFESESVTIRNCVVHDYNGDGISFQVSSHVTVEDCVSENNAGIGIHPGSGSQNPILRRNLCTGNGTDGIYVCWRVKHGLFEANELRGNKSSGISIGHKDTDNLFRQNVCTLNGFAGVLFRNESEPMGAHRNVFEENRIVDNGTGGQSAGEAGEVVIRGHHNDLVFRHNVIGRTESGNVGSVGILSNRNADHLQADDNQFVNVQIKVISDRK